MEKVKLTARDGVEIAGLWWDKGGGRSALLLHMMPATKESWIPLAEQLSAKGLNVLAIDFRGHGESGGGDYRKFSDDEHGWYFDDAKAAKAWLRSKYPEGELVVAGASIGANVAIYLLAENSDVRRVVALSAGQNYHGINAEQATVAFRSESQKLLLIASLDDGDNSVQNQLLHELCLGSELLIVSEGGHGTDLFITHPGLLDKVANYLIS